MTEPTRDRLAVLAWFAAAVALIWRQDPVNIPLLLDNQVYYFLSERVASGVAPHVSLMDAKTQLAALATGAAIALGRLFGADDLYAARTVSVLVAATAIAGSAVLARRLGGTRIAGHASVAVWAAFPGFTMLAAMGARPKVFLAAAEVGLLLALDARRYVLAAVFGTLCFLSWQPALLLLGVAGLVALAGPRPWPTVATMVAVSLGLFGLYELYFAAHGALGEQLWQTFVLPAAYPKPNPPMPVLLRYLFALQGPEPTAAPPLLLATAAVAAATLWGLISWRRTLALAARNPALVALGLGAVLGAGFLLIDFQGYPDRFLLVPMVATVCGCVLAAPLRRSGARVELAAVVVALVVAAGVAWKAPVPRQSGTLANQRKAAALVGRFLAEGNTVYAVGPPHLLALNRTGNFHYYGIMPWRVRAHVSALTARGEPFVPERDGKLPDIVLESRVRVPLNQRWLRQYYEPRSFAALAGERVQAWIRKPDAAAP